MISPDVIYVCLLYCVYIYTCIDFQSVFCHLWEVVSSREGTKSILLVYSSWVQPAGMMWMKWDVLNTSTTLPNSLKMTNWLK